MPLSPLAGVTLATFPRERQPLEEITRQLEELQELVPLLQEARSSMKEAEDFRADVFAVMYAEREKHRIVMAKEREEGFAQLAALLVIERAKGLEELAAELTAERKKGLAEITAALHRLHEDLATIQQVVVPANPRKRQHSASE